MRNKNLLKIAMSFSFFPFVASVSHAQDSKKLYPDVNKIEDYNNALPYWGTTWTPESGSENGYHPSFYTGFAARSEFPERIHIRQARGNQTRVTVVLDRDTVSDYLFDLVKRDQVYSKLVKAGKIAPIADSNGAPQLRMFSQVVNSPAYGIPALVASAKSGSVSAQKLYTQSLAILSALNPGRVFQLNLNLTQEFLKWRETLKKSVQGNVAEYLKNPQNEIIAIDTLLWGRINYSEKPTEEVRAKLNQAVLLALSENENKAFLTAALDLFKAVTGSKYEFQVVKDGAWQDALQCTESLDCRLSYAEFTGVYPTGSAVGSMSDGRGNSISAFASPGLWKFYNKGGKRSVDNIRSEPYYGWIPKMDYEAIGNGYHNPAVRASSVSSAIKAALGADSRHSSLWAVMRGPVSHGCSRLPAGHAWEMRQILPVADEVVAQTYVHINGSKHFDLYDVDGNGTLEVIGVEYLVRYGLKNGDRRETGGSIDIDPKLKESFYGNLYGKNKVFTSDGEGGFVFQDPSAALPSYLDFNIKSSKIALEFNGDFKLYEQKYEKDKIQFYRKPSSTALIQLMGRIKGSAPVALKSAGATNAGEANFDKQATAFGL